MKTGFEIKKEILPSCGNCRRSYVDDCENLVCEEHEEIVTYCGSACIYYKPESEWW